LPEPFTRRFSRKRVIQLFDVGPRQWQTYCERERNAQSGASTRLVE
jgi:hypothetical protein